jgi:hypothetical protein
MPGFSEHKIGAPEARQKLMLMWHIGVPPGRLCFGFWYPASARLGMIPGYSAFGNSSGIFSVLPSIPVVLRLM